MECCLLSKGCMHACVQGEGLKADDITLKIPLRYFLDFTGRSEDKRVSQVDKPVLKTFWKNPLVQEDLRESNVPCGLQKSMLATLANHFWSTGASVSSQRIVTSLTELWNGARPEWKASKLLFLQVKTHSLIDQQRSKSPPHFKAGETSENGLHFLLPP